MWFVVPVKQVASAEKRVSSRTGRELMKLFWRAYCSEIRSPSLSQSLDQFVEC